MAGVDYFLIIDGVLGESRDATHTGTIQLSSWSWGAANAGTMQFGSGGGAGRATMQDFTFRMRTNAATPKLVQKLASGEHIPKAVLVCRKAGKTPHDYLKITFEDIVVATYDLRAVAGNDAISVEQIKLNFAKITYEYREQKADGSLGGVVVASHDMKQNRTA